MIIMEIQLIIRAPNQNIEDQVINCNADWTVLKLKSHLCEVYPCKPSIKEQKLIYSGHILLDHLQLKDIIRPEDVLSNVHILHLVYSGKYSPAPTEQDSASGQSTSKSLLHRQPHVLPDTSTETSPENVLRQRTHSLVPQVNNLPMPVGALPVFYYDPQTMAQMATLQQMYVQYWQSMNFAASTGNLPIMPNLQVLSTMPNLQVLSTMPNLQVLPTMPNLQVLQNNNNSPAADAPAQPQANQRINAEAAEDNDYANHDWFDNVFQYCRFLILLCVVYSYSTPERFMLVILCAVIALLYREGWFMRQSLEEMVLRRRNSIHAEVVENEANDLNELAPPNHDDANEGQELEAAMDGDTPPHAQHLDAVNNNQGFSALSILAAFFFSLVPEPPPPVNIN